MTTISASLPVYTPPAPAAAAAAPAPSAAPDPDPTPAAADVAPVYDAVAAASQSNIRGTTVDTSA